MGSYFYAPKIVPLSRSGVLYLTQGRGFESCNLAIAPGNTVGCLVNGDTHCYTQGSEFQANQNYATHNMVFEYSPIEYTTLGEPPSSLNDFFSVAGQTQALNWQGYLATAYPFFDSLGNFYANDVVQYGNGAIEPSLSSIAPAEPCYNWEQPSNFFAPVWPFTLRGTLYFQHVVAISGSGYCIANSPTAGLVGVTPWAGPDTAVTCGGYIGNPWGGEPTPVLPHEKYNAFYQWGQRQGSGGARPSIVLVRNDGSNAQVDAFTIQLDTPEYQDAWEFPYGDFVSTLAAPFAVANAPYKMQTAFGFLANNLQTNKCYVIIIAIDGSWYEAWQLLPASGDANANLLMGSGLYATPNADNATAYVDYLAPGGMKISLCVTNPFVPSGPVPYGVELSASLPSLLLPQSPPWSTPCVPCASTLFCG